MYACMYVYAYRLFPEHAGDFPLVDTRIEQEKNKIGKEKHTSVWKQRLGITARCTCRVAMSIEDR